MTVLFAILVLCTLALVGVGVAVLWRMRKHMRRQTSDTTMMKAVPDAEEQKTGVEH
jgi:hypothetical protein